MTVTAIGFASCGILLYFFGPQVETSHEKVLAAARKIVSFDPPPGFRGTLAETIDYRFALFRSARFEHESGRGVLVLAEVRLIGPPHQQVEAMKSLLDRVSREIRTLDRPARVTRNHALGDHTVVFDLLTGEDLASTTRYSQLTGEFPVPPGVGRVWLQLESDLWQETEIDQFIASLAPAVNEVTTPAATAIPARTIEPATNSESVGTPADLPNAE